MYCPNCSASVADDSNFCPRCGTPFQKRSGFVAKLWLDNKPGFLILSVLLIAMPGSIGYYLSSRSGRFVVSIETISEQEALAIVTAATLKEFCIQFERDCNDRTSSEIEASIKQSLPRLLNPLKPGQSYARIVYDNGTNETIAVARFKYRRPPGQWASGDTQVQYDSKIQNAKLAIQLAGQGPNLQEKLALALMAAVRSNHGSFNLAPKEKKTWRLSNVDRETEFQVDYDRTGKPFSTQILKAR